MTDEKRIFEADSDRGAISPAEPHPPEPATQSARGFTALVATQFLGAVNDNILKGILIYMVIDGAWTGRLGAGGQGIVSLCLTVPFLLLSGIAGEFADRHSKRYVSILMKIAEIPIAMAAMAGLRLGSLWLTLSAMLALACQSAIFGPAKYGMIPELVPAWRLSRANGLINLMTNAAVIVGTLAAGWMADMYSPLKSSSVEASLWLPGVALVIVAFAGLITVSFLTPLPLGDPAVHYSRNPFATYVWSIRKMSESPLLLVALADGYFYFLAGLALLILPEYTIVLEAYQVSRSEVGILMGILGVAIGLGCAAAGFVSGRAIRPGLIPVGAAGLTVFFVLLGIVPPTVPDLPPAWRMIMSSHSALILGAGFSAGFYSIPLQSLIQYLSPDDERGRILGTANAISFSFLTASALVYYAIRPAFTFANGAEHPEKIFLLCAALMMMGIIALLMAVRSRGLTLARVASA